MKQGRNHYTPQEFARLFHIDKQTLIYYDNQGIFSPAFRSEKGYRYYEAGHADSQAGTPHAAQSPLPCQNIFPRCLSKECPSHHGVCRSPFRQRFGNRRQPSRRHALRLVRTLRLPPAADLAPCAKPGNGESPHPPRRTLSDLHLFFAVFPSSECRPFNHRKYDAGPLPFPRRPLSRHATSG